MLDQGKRDELQHSLEKDAPAYVALLREREELYRRFNDKQAELEEHKSLLNLALIDKDLQQRALLEHKDDLRAAEQRQHDYQLALERLREAAPQVDRVPSPINDSYNDARERSDSILQQELAERNQVIDSPRVPAPLRIRPYIHEIMPELAIDGMPEHVIDSPSVDFSLIPAPLKLVQHIRERDRTISELHAQIEILTRTRPDAEIYPEVAAPPGVSSPLSVPDSTSAPIAAAATAPAGATSPTMANIMAAAAAAASAGTDNEVPNSAILSVISQFIELMKILATRNERNNANSPTQQ